MTTPTSETSTRPRGLPNLESLVKARGFASLSAAAPAIGLDQAHLYKIARGRMDPTASTVARIARALGCSADFLLGLASVECVNGAAVEAAVAVAAQELGSK